MFLPPILTVSFVFWHVTQALLQKAAPHKSGIGLNELGGLYVNLAKQELPERERERLRQRNAASLKAGKGKRHGKKPGTKPGRAADAGPAAGADGQQGGGGHHGGTGQLNTEHQDSTS